jgi:hypothetical protein
MPQTATIKSLTRAFRMMKAMQAQGVEWGEDYRRAAGEALKGILGIRPLPSYFSAISMASFNASVVNPQSN